MDFLNTDNQLNILLALAALKVINEYLDRWGIINRISPFFIRLTAINRSLTEELDNIEAAFKDRELSLTEVKAAISRIDSIRDLLTQKKDEVKGDA